MSDNAGNCSCGWAGWATALGLGAAAAVLFFSSMAGYVYPGESAHLMALWNGLDSSPFTQYPLAAFFARLLGGGNALGPVSGVVAVLALYRVVASFVRSRVMEETTFWNPVAGGRIAGAAAAVVFMLTPAVREASTHLEPRIFDVAWALVAFAALIPFARAPKSVAWLLTILVGVMAGMGLADSPMFLALFPLYFCALWSAAASRGSDARGYGHATLFVFAFIAAFFIYAPAATGDFSAMCAAHKEAIKLYIGPKAWLFVALFATLPFVLSLFASKKAFNESSGWAQWIFHVSMTFVSILAVATPLSPSALMRPYGTLPVLTSAFAAVTAGYLAVYWWIQAMASAVRTNESLDADSLVAVGRRVAYVAGAVYAVAVVFTLVLNLFAFDPQRGAFADKVAKRVIADLGERRWFVTDGTLDDHIRFAAAAEGREVNLICLQRDVDSGYIKELTEVVKTNNVGGVHNKDLVLSLSLGVLTFIQDWFAADPDVARQVAVWGAPDLWYTGDHRPVPELLFFGGDPGRIPDWSAWKEFDEILRAPQGWGSYRLWKTEDPVEKLRLGLRRHMGFVANNRGVWLQDAGRDDEAFGLYELVLGEIDADNVSALFNEFELARSGNAKAAAKKRELEAELKSISADGDRRYRLMALGNYYGYIRSPEVFIRLGFSWARSGRPGEAMRQIRRAIDLVPSEGRATVLNMMASLYASENDQRKSREVYEEVLAKDSSNHDALLGMMRLALMDGESDKAIEYLQKATEAAGDDPRSNVEVAMLKMMKGDLDAAKAMLRKATDADLANLQAWSMLAAVTMQQIDAAKDEAVRSRLMKELRNDILLTMEKQARSPNDYYLMTTKAFVLMREGDDRARDARDALVAASKDRPDIASTSGMILGLDMKLNDTVDAERQARETLRRNRRDAMANYIMGSLALQKGSYDEAEAFLRRSASAKRPPALALNDLAEVLRRGGRLGEAEAFARKAVETAPELYVAWETLGSVILDSKGDLDEAEKCIRRACELSKSKDGREEDVRMLISLARVQIARGDAMHGKLTIRRVQSRIGELSEYEKSAFEELRKSAR